MKEIKKLGAMIWNLIIKLSHLAIYKWPQLLKLIIGITCVLSNAQGAFSSLFLNFYEEISLSYQKLEKEISYFLQIPEEDQLDSNRKNKEVCLLE